MDLLELRASAHVSNQGRFYPRTIDPGLPGIVGTFDPFGAWAATGIIRTQLKNRRVGFL
jgi:hypothetical protein